MYRCEKHGELKNEWCAQCGDIVRCDCSNLTDTRFKDLTYDTESGEHTVTIYLTHCDTCGNTFDLRFK